RMAEAHAAWRRLAGWLAEIAIVAGFTGLLDTVATPPADRTARGVDLAGVRAREHAARVVLVRRAIRREVGAGLATEVVAIALLGGALVAVAANPDAAGLVERATGSARQARGDVRPEVQAGLAAEVGAVAFLEWVRAPVAALAGD